MPAASRDEYASRSPGRVFERLSQAPLLAVEPNPARRRSRRRAPVRSTQHLVAAASWLGEQLRAWPPAARRQLTRALEQAGYAAVVLAEDEARPLLELGQLPFYRLDLYRHWLLAQGGPDLLAVLRQHSSHLDDPATFPTDSA